MNKFIPISMTAVLILAIALSGCGGGGVKTPTLSFSIAESLVPGAASFPTGEDDSDSCSTVNYPYYIAQTEVTYRLWSTVYDWAIAHGYTFANPGSRGGYYNDDENKSGTYASGRETDPVTTISWRDAIVWCNALTEYYNVQNKTSLDYVYKSGGNPIKNATDTVTCDTVVPDNSAKGFRLPTSMEWELAARYKDGRSWTPGAYASGATADTNNTEATKAVAWCFENSNYPDSNIRSTQPVGGKTANSLGIKDMSGNVMEWCFTEKPPLRVIRGGTWHDDASDMQLRSVTITDPGEAYNDLGFRPVRTR